MYLPVEYRISLINAPLNVLLLLLLVNNRHAVTPVIPSCSYESTLA